MTDNPSILILFATHTGNSEDLANELDTTLKNTGAKTSCMSVYDTDPSILTKHTACVLFVSTWGEGDPPDDAVEFYEALEEQTDLDLGNLKFAVYGLGDSDYDDFNECGKNFDRMFEERKATRLLPRVDADVDYEEPLETWTEELKNKLNLVPA